MCNRYEKIKQISELVVGMQKYEWEKIVHVISKKYAEESNKVTLEDSSALERTILMEF